MAIKLNAYRGQVADDLCAVRIKADEQGALAPSTSCRRKGAAWGGFRGARKAGDQHASATVIAAAQHGIEPLHATRHTLVGSLGVRLSARGGCARDGKLQHAFAHQKW